eukprot:TRINITY_DN23646_c0_g2_i2.p1 TRINITY_DN23646_c0_g2~~TRINITY_DN23646_c0_g2_i2.p1  ORF type:complete len:530 (+),score=210.87 TRINITY_DN23646_c0_g2_i2:162-1592(+)
MAEGVGCVDIVTGAITRHVKFAKDKSKQLLCWYLVDSLSKKFPTTFGVTFGPQILDLAVNHMTWEGKEEDRYVKLVETWRNIFGGSTCEDILRLKDVRKAEKELEEREKAEREAQGLPAEDAPKKPQWDTKDLIIGNVQDGQVVERIAPCKYYLLGVCNNPDCSQPHPPGRFGSMSDRKVFGSWVCLKCGHKNGGVRKKCWRNDCTGTKPELMGVNLQSLFVDPLVQTLGYDPGVGIEEDRQRNAAAVEHYKDQDWDAWRAERKRKLTEVLHAAPRVTRTAKIARTEPANASRKPCRQCGLPLKASAAFCAQCGAKQGAQAPVPLDDMEEDRQDMLFPSTRSTLQEVPCSLSGAVSALLETCRGIFTSDEPSLLTELLNRLEQCTVDPTYQQLPQERSSLVLRAISTAYSRWVGKKSPSDPTPSFIRSLAPLQQSLHLQDIDEEVFKGMLAAAAQCAVTAPVMPVTPPEGGGTVSL